MTIYVFRELTVCLRLDLRALFLTEVSWSPNLRPPVILYWSAVSFRPPVLLYCSNCLLPLLCCRSYKCTKLKKIFCLKAKWIYTSRTVKGGRGVELVTCTCRTVLHLYVLCSSVRCKVYRFLYNVGLYDTFSMLHTNTMWNCIGYIGLSNGGSIML